MSEKQFIFHARDQKEHKVTITNNKLCRSIDNSKDPHRPLHFCIVFPLDTEDSHLQNIITQIYDAYFIGKKQGEHETKKAIQQALGL